MSLNHSPKIVTDGLVLCLDAASRKSYPGSGATWFDRSGNGNHGTLTNGPTFSSANGGSLVFDGTDDYVACSGLSGSFSSFTVIVWFYPTVVINYKNVLDCNNSYNGLTGNIGPRLEMNSLGNLGFVYSNITSSNESYYSHEVKASGLTPNNWHCASITYNGETNTSVTFYNGLPTGLSRVTTGSVTGFIGVMNNITIGKGFNFFPVNRIFTGKISNVHIYRRSLTSQEILQNFNATRGRYNL